MLTYITAAVSSLSKDIKKTKNSRKIIITIKNKSENLNKMIQ